jgi:hypothetical protein
VGSLASIIVQPCGIRCNEGILSYLKKRVT